MPNEPSNSFVATGDSDEEEARVSEEAATEAEEPAVSELGTLMNDVTCW
jgi:hypothetical protein